MTDGKVCVNYGEEEEFSVVDYDCNSKLETIFPEGSD